MSEDPRQRSFAFADADPLTALAREMGIAEHWRDIEGVDHTVTDSTRLALLRAMGVAIDSAADAAPALAALRARRAARRLPEEVLIPAGGAVSLPLRGAWRLDLEDGGAMEGEAERVLRLSPPDGVHRLHAGDDACVVVVAPPRAPSPRDVAGRPRLWGAMAPMWGLWTARSTGVGDYADLAAAATSMGGLGADFLGINPVHALGAAHDGVSPYSPSSRIAYATDPIAPERLLGFDACPAAQALAAEAAPAAKAARAGPLASYDAHAAITAPVLRALFDATADHDPGFAAWRGERGAALEPYALFEAISLRLGRDWRLWPEDCRAPDRPGAARMRRDAARDVTWRLWLQYAADLQLGQAQAAARDAGMGLGLYLDIAVGVRPDGADVWMARDAFAHGVSLGAPPDRLAPAGQTWGLAPFRPDGLRAAAYAPFRAALRAAMRHAGMVRIDHVLGFARSYWAPEDGAPGGYVRYPLDALLALTRLEAARADCVVVGEDLGTVPDGLRAQMDAAGLHGCAVMQFERDSAGGFVPPSRWRPGVAASFGTHDTPTLRGWMRGRDIDWREKTGDYDARAADTARDARARDRAALQKMLRGAGHPADDEDATHRAAHAALAESPAALVAMSLDDALDAVEQQNLPGDVAHHPNWRRRLSVAADALHAAPGVQALAAIMRRARARGR